MSDATFNPRSKEKARHNSAGMFRDLRTIAQEHANLENSSKHRDKRGPRGKVGRRK
jgi:hypothetical protein